MSRNHYSEIHLHLVWHTKESLPLLLPDVEAMTHRSLRAKLISTPGAFVHEIGGIETHIHVGVTIPPTILISDLIGQLKGASAHEVNQRLGRGRKLLQWQAGYGVVSFGTKDLGWVKAYIRNQRQHHARGRPTTGWNGSWPTRAPKARSPVNGAHPEGEEMNPLRPATTRRERRACDRGAARPLKGPRWRPG